MCCCWICSTFCWSGFFAAAVGLTEFVGLVCETDGAALADAAAAGVVAAAGVAVVLAAAGLALGDVFALAAGDFISLLRAGDCSFFAAGVALAAGCSTFLSIAAGGGGFRGGVFFRVF